MDILPLIVLMLASCSQDDGRERDDGRTPAAQAIAPALDPRPLDLVIENRDPNGFPLNPRFAKHLPDADAECDKFMPPNVLGDPPCTSYPGLTIEVAPVRLIGTCRNLQARNLPAHINYEAVTVTGTIYFKSMESGLLVDGDYNLLLRTPGSPGRTAHNPTDGGDALLKLEFDSREVVKQWRSSFWQAFKRAVDRNQNRDDPLDVIYREARSMINGRHAVVTGLLGLDAVHKAHAEIHPVTALAVRTSSTSNSETWSMFVRRAGNEGYCSSQTPLKVETPDGNYRFEIPWRAGATSASVQKTSGSIAFTNRTVDGGKLILVTRLPLGIAVEDIDLTITWNTNAPLQAIAGGGDPAYLNQVGADEDEAKLTQLDRRLTPQQRAQVDSAVDASLANLESRIAAFKGGGGQVTLSVGAGSRQPVRATPTRLGINDLAVTDSAVVASLCRIFNNQVPGFGRCQAR